jgi:hypothetical protein
MTSTSDFLQVASRQKETNQLPSTGHGTELNLKLVVYPVTNLLGSWLYPL